MTGSAMMLPLSFFGDLWASVQEWASGLWDSIYLNLIESDRYMIILNGLLVTLEITFFAVIIGTVLGVIAALMKISSNKLLSGISSVYITVMRGTPLVTQLPDHLFCNIRVGEH